MLVLLLIGVQYLHNAAFNFEKGSSFSKSLLRLSPPGKKILLSKISTFPSTLSTPDTHTHELFFRMVVLLLGSHFLVKYLYSFDEQSQTKDTISWIALFPIIDIFLVKYVISYSTFLKDYISNNNHNKSIKWVYNWLLKWQSFSLMDNYFLSLYLMACKIGLSSKSHWLWG